MSCVTRTYERPVFTGKSGKSTASVSAESIERSPEPHRRSKSILKRHQNQAASQAAAALLQQQHHQHHQQQQDSSSVNDHPPPGNHGHRMVGIRRTARVDPETEKLIPDSASDCSPGKSPMSPLQQPPQPQPRPVPVAAAANNNNNRTGGGRGPVEVSLLQDLLEDTGGPIFICPPPPPMSAGDSDKRYS